MASETGTTALTNIINSEAIEQMIADYVIDKNVFSRLATFRSIAGKATKTHTFTRWVKDSGGDITEATAISNTAMSMAENSVTAAQVGIAREITDFAAATTIMGEAAIYQRVLEDGAALCLEMLEDDLAALMASLTGTAVGATGVNLSVANILEAIARLRTAKVTGKIVSVLDDQACYDFTAAVAAATGAVFGGGNIDQDVLNSRMDGEAGSFMGVRFFYSNLTDTANTAADVVSGMWVDPASNDEQCAIAWVQLWAPRVRERIDPYIPSREMSVTMAYGAGVKYAALGIPITTDA